MEKVANNLDALADRIYQEGVEKAEKKAEILLAEAKKEKERLLASAREEAEEIKETARKEAEQLKKNAQSELQMNARQLIGELKSRIVQLLNKELINKPLAEAFTDKAFLQELALSLAKAWQPQEEVRLLLSEEMAENLGDKAMASIKKELNDMPVALYHAQDQVSFKIQHKEEGFEIAFDEEAFADFFGGYFEEKVRKSLFADHG